VNWTRRPKSWFWFAGIVAVFGVMGFFLQPAWIAGLHFPFAAALAGIGFMLLRQRDAR
jgi:hypothetical protein